MPAGYRSRRTYEAASMNSSRADHDRFLSLLETHQRPLLKVCWAYAGSSHDRDDLLQEIVGRLWSAFETYDPSRTFMTWMYRVALNVAIDFQRRRRRWGRTTNLGEADTSLPAATTDETEQSQQLRELLDGQSAADRAILLLYLEGHSYREIGDVLGISESNVGTRLNRLRNSLRQSARRAAGEVEGA